MTVSWGEEEIYFLAIWALFIHIAWRIWMLDHNNDHAVSVPFVVYKTYPYTTHSPASGGPQEAELLFIVLWRGAAATATNVVQFRFECSERDWFGLVPTKDKGLGTPAQNLCEPGPERKGEWETSSK